MSNRLLKTKDGAPIGSVVETYGGFYFVPHIPGRRSSRKKYPTAEACVPRWAQKICDPVQLASIRADAW